MSVIDVITNSNIYLTEIKKCVNLYNYCEDKTTIYNHLVQKIYQLQDGDVISGFANSDINENSSLDDLKVELLKLYDIYTKEFLQVVSQYNNESLVA